MVVGKVLRSPSTKFDHVVAVTEEVKDLTKLVGLCRHVGKDA